MKHIAIVLAAGRGKRMNSTVAKQYLLIREKPVLYYALKQFENSFIDEIILVTGAEDIAYCTEEIVKKYGFTKICKVVAGGKERYHSVYQGLLVAKQLLQGEQGCIYPSTDRKAFRRAFLVRDTVMTRFSEVTMHRLPTIWAQMGVMIMFRASGSTMGPPADRL